MFKKEVNAKGEGENVQLNHSEIEGHDHLKVLSTDAIASQRKEKSLGYLCERVYRNRNEIISIDDASKELNVQRRRMYEILNIMKSVGLISRVKTCAYKWEGFETMIQHLRYLKNKGPPTKTHEELCKDMDGSGSKKGKEKLKKGSKHRAVATCLSERFIQLFLCNECPQPIVLENVTNTFTDFFGNTSNPVSRGRRLYDIANVFCTLGLIRKTVAIDTRTKKRRRLYTWCGPSLDENGGRQPEAEVSAKRQKLSDPLTKNENYVHPPTTFNWGETGRSSEKTMWGSSNDTETYLHESNRKMLESDPSDMESAVALRAELGRLARALRLSEQREHNLRSHIESQKCQINKLIEKVPQPVLINSPITNIVFTPYGRNGENKKRTGPALPSLESDGGQHISRKSSTPSSYLIATAASSLLSLTPSKPEDQPLPSSRVSSMTLPTLDSPGPTPTPPPPVAAATRLEARSISLPEVSPDAPSVPTRKTNEFVPIRTSEPDDSKYIFGALSPLPNAQVWDI